MATPIGSSTQKHYCPICDVGYTYKSRLDRHFQSEKHKYLSHIRNSECESEKPVEQSCLYAHSDGNESAYNEQADLDMSPKLIHMDKIDIDVFVSQCSDSSYEESVEDEVDDILSLEVNEDDFWPFPSKEFALLYFIHHSPNPLGDSNVRFIWHVMQQLKPSIPSISQVKDFRLPSYCEPQKHYTTSGIPFYMNSPSMILRKLLSTPSIANELHRYPEIPEAVLREIYHGLRWRDHPIYQAPSAPWRDTNLYVGDFVLLNHPSADLSDTIIAKILKFYTRETRNGVFASIEPLVTINQFSKLHPHLRFSCVDYECMVPDEITEIAVSEIKCRVSAPTKIVHFHEQSRTFEEIGIKEYCDYVQPSALKTKGLPVVVAPLLLYTDDTSGNRSKKWNKFDLWCLMLAGLPRHYNSLHHHVHFLCCSNKANCMDMVDALVEDLKQLENGTVMFDSSIGKDVFVIAPILAVLADNPRHSELLNHLGSTANLYCRMCMVDKNADPTKVCEPRTKELAEFHIQCISNQPTESGRNATKTKFGMRGDANSLLTLTVDLFECTPVETLHTILLGPYKYLLKRTLSQLSAPQKKQILARIRTFSYSGFRGKVIGNIISYHKSFVGRDYKAWAQMALFVILPYLSDPEKKVWISLSKVFQIAYCKPYSSHMLHNSQEICQQFVDTVKNNMPEMLQKQKIHLLLHLPQCLQAYGPTSCFNTERCEAFNSKMRSFNVYSNKASSSRDIAQRFTILEDIRHICDGGILHECRSIGAGLVQLYHSKPVQQYLNGVNSTKEKVIFSAGTLRKKQTKSLPLSEVQLKLEETVTIGNLPSFVELVLPDFDHLAVVYQYHAVMSQARKLVNNGCYVQLARSYHGSEYGVLLTSIMCTSTLIRTSLVRLLDFENTCGQPLLNEFDCPLMTLTDVIVAVEPSDIKQEVSIMHECTETCKFEQGGQRMVEREKIESNSLLFVHDYANNWYCLNTYCMI